MQQSSARASKRRRVVHVPGSAPGILVAADGALPTEIRFMQFNGKDLVEEGPVPVEELPEPGHGLDGRVLWVDVVGTGGIDELEAIGERFGLHPLALEDVVNVNQRPKLETFEDDLFMIVRMAALDVAPGEVDTEQLSVVLRKGLVITFQERPGDCFERVRERLRVASRRIRNRGADYLAYALLDSIIDGYQPVLDGFEVRLEEIEERLLGTPDTEDLKLLHRLRRDLISLRRGVAPVRDVVLTLMREPEEGETVTEETRLFLRDAYDHVLRTVEQIDTFRELCASLMDLYLSTVSNRTNDVMKVLTMIATVFIPLSFMVGLYGMNFDTSSPYNMPELTTRYGYPILIGAMILVVAFFVAFFRRKNWL